MFTIKRICNFNLLKYIKSLCVLIYTFKKYTYILYIYLAFGFLRFLLISLILKRAFYEYSLNIFLFFKDYLSMLLLVATFKVH